METPGCLKNVFYFEENFLVETHKMSDETQNDKNLNDCNSLTGVFLSISFTLSL